MSKEIVARLRKYDPRANCNLRTYSVAGRKFTNGMWVVVDKTTGEYLKGVRQINGDENSPLAFDVMTKEEAEDLEAREREEIIRKTAPARFPKGSDAVRVVNPAMEALRLKASKTSPSSLAAPEPSSTLTPPPGVEEGQEEAPVEETSPDMTAEEAVVKKPAKVKIPIKR